VELADGEEGVAPGQACAFYDARVGQARMLGGGFIQSTGPRSDSDAIAAARRAASIPSPHVGESVSGQEHVHNRA
jgi:tRNA-specific 2-thiouridylase